MELDPNFAEFIESLHAHDARFLIVGGYAVAFHGHPRFTADLDVWVFIGEENAQAVVDALADFGFADAGLSVDDFLAPDRVVRLGYPPLRSNLMTTIDGVRFDDAYGRREVAELDGLEVPFISLDDLRVNKAASGRTQDLADLEALESGEAGR